MEKIPKSLKEGTGLRIHLFVQESHKNIMKSSCKCKGTWSRPVQALCMLPVSVSCSVPWSVVFWRPCFLGIPILSDSCALSAPSSSEFPEHWGEGFDGDIPFRTECFKVSHTLYNVCLCICSHLLQEEASLVMADQGTDLWVQQNVIGGHFIVTFFV